MLTADLNLSRRMGAEFEMTVPRIGSGSDTHVRQSIANCLTANGVHAMDVVEPIARLGDGFANISAADQELVANLASLQCSVDKNQGFSHQQMSPASQR